MFTKIECGECGKHYRPVPGRPSNYRCVGCGHEVARADLVLDDGEHTEVRMGVLGYATAEVA